MKIQESSPLLSKEKYLVQNQSITEIDTNKQLPTDSIDIGPDDEVWLLQCPKSINADALINRKIKLPGKAHHELIESVAELYPNAENISLGVRTNKGYKIKNLPVVGKISIRERLQIQNFDAVNDHLQTNASKKTERVKFPENLKIRHPLLGADYQEKIEIRPDVAARLKEAVAAGANVESSKTRSRPIGGSGDRHTTGSVRVKVEGGSKSSGFDKVQVKVEAAVSSLNVKKEKKRKRKRDDDEEVVSSTQKTKKIKIEKIDDKKDLEWIKKF